MTCQYDSSVTERGYLYGDVPAGHNKRSIVTPGEIIGVNPNSRETVKTVLIGIGKASKVGTDREWIRVGCDGVPYNIASSLLNDIYICNDCGEEIDISKTPLIVHLDEKHKRNKDKISFKLHFDYVLLVPGVGHLEINLFRALFSFCREIFLEFLAGKLGFVSKKATDFIIGCGDHHLTWQVYQIALYAIASELCRVYYLSKVQDGSDTFSFENFVMWVIEAKNPNILMLFNIVYVFPCHEMLPKRHET